MKDNCLLITDLQRGKTFFSDNDELNRIIKRDKILNIIKMIKEIKNIDIIEKLEIIEINN